jgi:staphylococcal nuclease domain-containing protein 1
LSQSVISGDTLVLIGKGSNSGPPQEITVTLASVQSPRISRGPQQLQEDPFAFESREFLRKLCIGKNVVFRIVYCVTSISKYFGDIEFLFTQCHNKYSLNINCSAAITLQKFSDLGDQYAVLFRTCLKESALKEGGGYWSCRVVT